MLLCQSFKQRNNTLTKLKANRFEKNFSQFMSDERWVICWVPGKWRSGRVIE